VTEALDELFPLITQVISERLGFYHTGIFLLDEVGEYAILKAANSEGGQRMLERGYKLRAGRAGIVGFVANTGRPRIAADTGSDALYFNNTYLPRTRSEIALPLHAGGRLIGVLDVQSEQPSAFQDDDIETLNTLANQVAIVIQNARLFDQVRTTLRTYMDSGRRGWLEHIENRAPGYSYLPDGTLTAPTPEKREQFQDFITSERPVVLDSTTGNPTAALAIPVKLRDQVIGIIHIEARDANRKWSDDEVGMVQSISERAALALENARLFEETSRRAERERVIASVTSRIGESNNVERILRTTITELGRTLGAARAFIQLETQSSSSDDSSAQA
jgi:GAF domain-containing protein